MKISQLQKILLGFNAAFHEEFPFIHLFKNQPLFIQSIELLFENFGTTADRDLNPNELITLALIYHRGRRDESTEIANKQTLLALERLMGRSFVRLVSYFSAKNCLDEFGLLIAAHLADQATLLDNLQYLSDEQIDTLENLRLCFAAYTDIDHFEARVAAINHLHHFHPSLVTLENIQALLSFFVSPHGRHFHRVCERLKNLALRARTPTEASEIFALFLAAEHGLPDLCEVTKILRKADITLPAYQLHTLPENPFMASHRFAYQIASTAKYSIFAAKIIASFAFLRRSHSDIFQDYALKIILGSERYDSNLLTLLSNYHRHFHPVGDRDNGCLFLKSLFHLSESKLGELAVAIHDANPILVTMLNDYTHKISDHEMHSKLLVYAIRAVIKNKLPGKLTRADLNLLLNRPENAVLLAMSLGAIFSRKDSVIKAIFEGFKALSSFNAAAKNIPKLFLDNTAKVLGLSNELALLVTADTFEERHIRRQFFMDHLEPRVRGSCPGRLIAIAGAGAANTFSVGEEGMLWF